ncbi:MAG TPA: lipoate--protein ligase family protein [Gemmataceae bacterium]|jgi:lipoate-protein ligase A
MDFLDATLPALADNLALDEALLLDAEAGGGEALRVWEWPAPAVVLGAGGRIDDDVDVASCDRGGVPLARRSSGGGTVLLGPGCLLYSLVLRYDRAAELRDIRKSYGWILSRLTGALPGLTVEGPSDLAYGGRKVGGSAQQRKHDHLLHHGTLLYAFDLPLIGRYLKEPPRQPEYRGHRPHAEFVGNLPADGAAVRDRLRAAWGATPAGRPLPMEAVARLVDEKYSRPEWVRRR